MKQIIPFRGVCETKECGVQVGGKHNAPSHDFVEFQCLSTRLPSRFYFWANSWRGPLVELRVYIRNIRLGTSRSNQSIGDSCMDNRSEFKMQLGREHNKFNDGVRKGCKK